MPRDYDRYSAVQYAKNWWNGRNPAYYNFDAVGGDCTNFVSQCLYAGSGVMNYTRDTGWYYNSPSDRAAAWSGVEYLHRFLTSNKSNGPYATERAVRLAQPGDIIQLSFDGARFSHSLLVSEISPQILVCTHSDDSCDRPFSTYMYRNARLLHIEGVRGILN
ncbi:MAG: amidase domain-containing protein [Oscillospiraceae bacterium]|nr:amidase domain-containing protein [Oscillospiraceae bacterium]